MKTERRDGCLILFLLRCIARPVLDMYSSVNNDSLQLQSFWSQRWDGGLTIAFTFALSLFCTTVLYFYFPPHSCILKNVLGLWGAFKMNFNTIDCHCQPLVFIFFTETFILYRTSTILGGWVIQVRWVN